MESLICNFYLSVASRKNCVSRSVPEIHSHVAGTLSNQQTNPYLPQWRDWPIRPDHGGDALTTQCQSEVRVADARRRGFRKSSVYSVSCKQAAQKRGTRKLASLQALPASIKHTSGLALLCRQHHAVRSQPLSPLLCFILLVRLWSVCVKLAIVSACFPATGFCLSDKGSFGGVHE